jgi:hypothetical protein
VHTQACIPIHYAVSKLVGLPGLMHRVWPARPLSGGFRNARQRDAAAEPGRGRRFGRVSLPALGPGRGASPPRSPPPLEGSPASRLLPCPVLPPRDSLYPNTPAMIVEHFRLLEINLRMGCRVTVRPGVKPRSPARNPAGCPRYGGQLVQKSRVLPGAGRGGPPRPGCHTVTARIARHIPSRLSHRYRQDRPAYPVPAWCLPGACPVAGRPARPDPVRHRATSTGPVRHRVRIHLARCGTGLQSPPGRPARTRRPAPRTGRTAIISAIRAAGP